MVNGLVPAGAIVVYVLSKDNYDHWSALVKNYLLAQDLWDVVEATVPEEADQFIAWRKKTAAALYAIQISCGPDAFSVIKGISSAKIAWDTLARTFKPQRWRSVQSANTSNNPDENNYLCRFFAAVEIGDWEETNNILRQYPNAIRARYSTGGTALHIATKFGHEVMVENLVQLMTAADLEIQDFSWTALHLAARLSLKMVKCMVDRNSNLLGMVEKSHGLTPILFAAKNDLWDIVHYLYRRTPIEDLMPENGPYGAGLVCFCFYAKQFDLAWALLQRCPQLAITKGPNGESPIFVLADIPSVFPSGTPLKFWQRWIYDYIRIQPLAIPQDGENAQNPENELGNQGNFSLSGLLQRICSTLHNLLGIHIQPPAIPDVSEHVQNPENELGNQRNISLSSGTHIQPLAMPGVIINVQNTEIELGNQRNISFSGLLQGISSNLHNLLGINHIREMKLIHHRSLNILDYMCEVVKHVVIQEREDGLVYEAIFQAVRRGIIEFVIGLCKVDPDVLWQNYSMGRNIFHYSIECRQEKVYSLIYGVDQRHLIATFSDAFGNDMLHLAGMLSPTEKLDRISGAALQMQRERQWFKVLDIRGRNHHFEASPLSAL